MRTVVSTQLNRGSSGENTFELDSLGDLAVTTFLLFLPWFISSSYVSRLFYCASLSPCFLLARFFAVRQRRGVAVTEVAPPHIFPLFVKLHSEASNQVSVPASRLPVSSEVERREDHGVVGGEDIALHRSFHLVMSSLAIRFQSDGVDALKYRLRADSCLSLPVRGQMDGRVDQYCIGVKSYDGHVQAVRCLALTTAPCVFST